jgi:hypothetical protein
MILSRRSAALALSSLGLVTLLPRSAHATTALVLRLEELVARTERVVVGKVVHIESEWAYVAGAERIVTVSRVVQEDDLLRTDAAQDEVQIMTLGGKVGNLRQKVAGEAALQRGQRCVLFASKEDENVRRVVGMAQGYYPLLQQERLDVLSKSQDLPHLIGARPQTGPERSRAAIDVLSGQTLKSARDLIAGAR